VKTQDLENVFAPASQDRAKKSYDIYEDLLTVVKNMDLRILRLEAAVASPHPSTTLEHLEDYSFSSPAQAPGSASQAKTNPNSHPDTEPKK
jgi:hypothetical protein